MESLNVEPSLRVLVLKSDRTAPLLDASRKVHRSSRPQCSEAISRLGFLTNRVHVAGEINSTSLDNFHMTPAAAGFQ